MSGAPEQYRMSDFVSYDLLFLTPARTIGSDQLLTEHTERERSKQRFHSRFDYTVGSVTRRIWSRTVEFRVSCLSSWCVT